MLVKNISDSTINLKTGSVLPGDSGKCNATEFDLLMSNNRIEIASEKPKRGRSKVVRDE